MSVYLQETGSLVVLDEAASLGAQTTHKFVNSAGADLVEVIALLGANLASGAGDQVTLEVVAAEDAAGTNAETVPLDAVFSTDGAPKIEDGTGVASREDLADGTTSWQTPLAKGNIQLQAVIPVRARRLPAGKPWLALRSTPGANARNITVAYYRGGASYGSDRGQKVL